MSLEQLLFDASSVGVIFALLGSYLISGGDRRGWWSYLAADVLLVGIQVYHHIWSQVALFVCFMLLSVRGILHARRP